MAFASRLKGLLNYYLESRRVDDFDGLFELLICDRIKSSLSEACLRHVLSVENATERGWLDVDALSDTVDKYAACYNNNNRPQAFAIGQNVTRAGAGPYKPPSPPQKFGSNVAPKSNNGGRFAPVNASGTRKCFHCGSFDHLRDKCPRLNRQTTDMTGRPPARLSRVNAVDNCNATRGACSQRAASDFHTSVVRGARGAGSRRVFHASSTTARDHADTVACRPGSGDHDSAACDSTRVSQYTTPIVDQSVQTEFNSAVSECIPDVYCNKINAAVNSDEFESVNDDLSVKMGQNEVNLCPVELSTLKYVEVNVSCEGTSCVKFLSGLCDSGAEVNVVSSSVVDDLFPVVRGKIKLKPFFGDPITADLVCLSMSLPDKDAINVWCAVVDKASDDLILSADTVQRLTQSKISAVTTRSANADTRIDDDDDDGDVAMSSGGDCTLDPSVNPGSVSDHQNDSGGENDDITSSSLINKAELIKEQRDDETLRGCWKLAERGRGNFLIDDGVLYRREKILGQPFQQLVVPKGRRSHVLKVGHETYGGHMSVKKTKARISYTFFWP